MNTTMTENAAQKLGLVDETNDEYHGSVGSVSKSHLDVIAAGSPRHYWHKYLNPNRETEEPTPALILGQAIHSAILEPHLFTSEFAAVPEDAPKRPTSTQLKAKNPSLETTEAIQWWAEFNKAAEGKTVLTADNFRICMDIRDAVHSHPVASGLICDGKAEQSVYAVDGETGETVKCRIDYLTADMIIDLKSTEDASPAAFGKSAAKYRYPVQQAWYQDVLDSAFGEHPPYWIFLAVEKTPPYAIGIYYLEPEDVTRGRIAARRDLLTIASCRRANAWPDYGTDARPLPIPGWAKL